LLSIGKQVAAYFVTTLFPTQPSHGFDLSALNPTGIFVPVLPLFDSSPSSSSKIPPVFFNSFLSEQIRSLEEKRKEIAKVITTNNKLITTIAAQLVITLIHVTHVCEAYSEGVDYIEDMLQKQLVAAIGKVVTPADFTNYLTFHNRKIYREEYRPQAFSYAIRRPEHYPEVFPFSRFLFFLVFLFSRFLVFLFIVFSFSCFLIFSFSRFLVITIS
jgi:hypothetical protein